MRAVVMVGLRRLLQLLALFVVGLSPTGVLAEQAGTSFSSRWTLEPVQKMTSGGVLKEGMSLVKYRLLPDSLFQINEPFTSADGKWKLAALTELDGMVSDLPIACSQTERRKAKYSVMNGSYFEGANLCFVDSDRDGAFDKSFSQSGFGLRWRTFEQTVNDSRSSDNRLAVSALVPETAVSITPVRYTRLAAESSKNILYLNIFYAGNHSLAGEFSLGFCIDYKVLEKSCASLRPMTFTKSFRKVDVPLRVTMIGSEFAIQRADQGTLQIELLNVPDRHQIKIISNPFDIE